MYVWFPTRKTPKSQTKEANCQLGHFHKLANGRGVVFGKDREDFPEFSAFYLPPVCKVGGGVGV